MINAPVSDVNIGSVRVEVPGREGAPLFLHTSPEYAMKRLLAAGSGDIFQVCRVFRGAERGRQHNPEFTMIEWYRLGFSLEQLMREVAELVRALLGRGPAGRAAELSRGGAAPRGLRSARRRRRRRCSARRRRWVSMRTRAGEAGRDELLDLIVGAQVGPALGSAALTFVHRYPASQAALARLDARGSATRAALRALSSGHGTGERLSRARECRPNSACASARISRRAAARGLPTHSLDPYLLAALDAGLPDCAGVALGFDRVLMLAMDASSIDEVLAFPVERA